MKTFLAIAAASADCPGHSKVQVSVDTQTKTASVQNTDMSKAADTQAIKEELPPKTE